MFRDMVRGSKTVSALFFAPQLVDTKSLFTHPKSSQVNDVTTPTDAKSASCTFVNPSAAVASVKEDKDQPNYSNDKPTIPFRIDYVLPEGVFESKFGYAALTSHIKYWNSPKLAEFVTKTLTQAEYDTQTDCPPEQVPQQKHTAFGT